MRRISFTTGLFIFCVVFLVAGTIYGIYAHWWPDFQNTGKLPGVLQARSVLETSLTISYDKPPIYKEQYTMRNDNGLSTAQYQITGYSGKVYTITVPPVQTFEVTFFFEQVVQDGIWKITNKEPRGNTDVHYRLYVHQVADRQQGSRTITFTDPHYWAATAGHEYQIQAASGSPNPNLVTLGSPEQSDPRYQKIVQDFRNFGPVSLRRKVAEVRRSILASK